MLQSGAAHNSMPGVPWRGETRVALDHWLYRAIPSTKIQAEPA